MSETKCSSGLDLFQMLLLIKDKSSSTYMHLNVFSSNTLSHHITLHHITAQHSTCNHLVRRPLNHITSYLHCRLPLAILTITVLPGKSSIVLGRCHTIIPNTIKTGWIWSMRNYTRDNALYGSEEGGKLIKYYVFAI